eukprot:SAG31_NODE_2169_length_6266_cov_11.590076_5_plen_62_part_00
MIYSIYTAFRVNELKKKSGCIEYFRHRLYRNLQVYNTVQPVKPGSDQLLPILLIKIAAPGP